MEFEQKRITIALIVIFLLIFTAVLLMNMSPEVNKVGKAFFNKITKPFQSEQSENMIGSESVDVDTS